MTAPRSSWGLRYHTPHGWRFHSLPVNPLAHAIRVALRG